MNRTFLPPLKNNSDKLTECTLSDEIHDNLRVLAFMYPFSEELEKVFERGMFIKSNPKAFPHVMRYLFLFCDAVEFRKKFAWPLYNKAAEATFRNSTLEFLNRINVKHSLGFGVLRNQIVVFPGGMDFMRVLYEVTKLSMRIVYKKLNPLPHTPDVISMQEAEQRLHNLEELFEITENHCKNLEQHGKELMERTKRMKTIIDDVTGNTTISSQMILSGVFESYCEDFQKSVIEKDIRVDLKTVKQFQEQCSILETAVSKVFEKREVEYKDEEIDQFLNEMRSQFPEYGYKFDKVILNHEIHIDRLLFTFDLALPMIMNRLTSFRPRSMETLQYEASGIEKLALKVSNTFFNLLMIDKRIKGEEGELNTGVTTMSKPTQMKTKILATPPISFNALQRTERLAIQPKRISLIDDNGLNNRSISGHNTMATKLTAINEDSILVTPLGLKSAKKFPLWPAPDKLDPIKMLRTMKKQKKVRPPLRDPKFLSSTLSQLKWHEPQIGDANESKISGLPVLSSTLIPGTPDAPGAECLDGPQATSSQLSTSTSPAFNSSDTIYDVKPNSVKCTSIKHRYATLDEREINTTGLHMSPSGRIDSLFNNKCDNKNLIKIRPFIIHQSDNVLHEPMAMSSPGKCSTSHLKMETDDSLNDNINCNNDNNPNISNISTEHQPYLIKPNLIHIITAESESLLNTSDTILTKFGMFDD